MPAFLTTSGLQKFAVATPEEPVTVKYMAVGSGTGTVSENIQSLFNEVYRTEIPNPLRDEDNPRNLEFTGYIPTTVGGWTITELGLYDDEGSLIAYHLLDESIVKSSPDSALKTDMYPTFVLALSNASDVELFVSSSINFEHAAITNRNHPNAHDIPSITGLVDVINGINLDINTKDAQNVKLTGNQAISGNKSFEGMLTSPDGQSNVSLGDSGEITINSGSGGQMAQVFFSHADGVFSLYGAKYRGDASELDAATTAKFGVARLATSVNDADNNDVLTAGIARGLGLGVGQTWKDVEADRQNFTLYTNTTGKPIIVSISALGVLTLYVNGVIVATSGSNAWTNTDVDTKYAHVSAVVPDGATYELGSVSVIRGGSRRWRELRA